MKGFISIKSFALGMIVTLLVVVSALSGAIVDRKYGLSYIDSIVGSKESGLSVTNGDIFQKILHEESVVIEVAEESSPSVVTVSITEQQRKIAPFFMDPFGLFGQRFFTEEETETIEQDIGTGFIVDQEQGFVVTNKHVVSNAGGDYKVITNDDQEFAVERIYRDPVNDVAILKISGDVPEALELGVSNNLKVGQFVIAIGTALGEFRHTVTTGVISGLGRGITAGNGFGGFVEELDNVIQTDAAINPGNSGGPLLNSAGQVIGVNTAVARASENIGFAIPINVVRESLENFNQTGQFDRPFLGVRYRIIPQETALMNDVPEGAFIVEVVEGSAADEAGLIEGDIIVSMDDKAVWNVGGGLAEIINELKPAQRVMIEVFRDGETLTIEAVMKVGDS